MPVNQSHGGVTWDPTKLHIPPVCCPRPLLSWVTWAVICLRPPNLLLGAPPVGRPHDYTVTYCAPGCLSWTQMAIVLLTCFLLHG